MIRPNWGVPRCSEPSRDARRVRAAERFHPLTAPAHRSGEESSGGRASRHSTSLRRVEQRAGFCMRPGVSLMRGRKTVLESCKRFYTAGPAFQFDRQTCFPAPTWQHLRHGAQRRRWEERSHPEPRAVRHGARAWRGWRAPDLARSEHRGSLVICRRDAPSENHAADKAGTITHSAF